MNGAAVIAQLKKKFRVNTDHALAQKIGMTLMGIHNWKKKDPVTTRQLAELVHKASAAGAKNMQASAIRPLVEFFPIAKVDTSQRKAYRIFSPSNGTGKTHKYLYGLRDEMDAHKGVYIFFDSRGQAIYTGKARQQSLWREINAAFNRDRGEVQKIKRVSHPTRNQAYKNSNEKSRQISDRFVPLHEIAAYVSAYDVIDGMINEVEALLVRSFANDLLNVRMERFGQQRRATKKKSTKKKAAANKRPPRKKRA